MKETVVPPTTSEKSRPSATNEGEGVPGTMEHVRPRLYGTSMDGAGSRSGWLGTFVLGFFSVLAAILFIAAVVVIAGVFLAAMAVALLILGIDRAILAINPRWRARREARGGFHPVRVVTITSSRALDRGKP